MSGWWIVRAAGAGSLVILASIALGPLRADGPEKRGSSGIFQEGAMGGLSALAEASKDKGDEGAMGGLSALAEASKDKGGQAAHGTPIDRISRDSGKNQEKPAAKLSPMSVNAACCICHMTFVREPISKVHLKAKVTCIKCHGLSAAHANDEDIGATKPEIVYKRGQIDKMCVECHETHDAPARLVVARCIQRGLSPKKAAVCTDCHGKHRIEKPPADEKPAEKTPPARE